MQRCNFKVKMSIIAQNLCSLKIHHTFQLVFIDLGNAEFINYYTGFIKTIAHSQQSHL